MSGKNLTPEQERCKQEVIENRGWWTELFDDILQLDPQWIATYSKFSAQPGETLDPKMKEFIHLAVDAHTSKMFNVGTRFHMEKAFNEGATVDEIVEVIELTVSAGIYSTLIEGASLLAAEAGQPDTDSDTAVKRKELVAEFEEHFGYWSELWDDVVATDPDHFEHMVELFAHPVETGPLEAREEELILLATSITTSHLYSKGARVHLQEAMEHGATREEILATIQTASVVGQHTTDEAMPIVTELADERGLLSDD